MISDALDEIGLKGAIRGIQPLFPGAKIVGPVVTVEKTLKEKAISKYKRSSYIDIADSGDVLFIDTGGCTDFSTWGFLASKCAMLRGIKGVVINGACRDVEEVRKLKFPVFSRSVVPVSGRGRLSVVSVNAPIKCMQVDIRPADLVVADDSGVLIVKREKIEEVLRIAKRISHEESEILRLLPETKSLTRAREILK